MFISTNPLSAINCTSPSFSETKIKFPYFSLIKPANFSNLALSASPFLDIIPSSFDSSIMLTELNNRLVKAIGRVSQYPEILKAGLEGTSIGHCKAADEVKQIICRLENAN